MADRVPAYAIWYGNLLDGVTFSDTYATEAHRNGAWVIRFDVERGSSVKLSDIPTPNGDRLPLGWHGIEVVT